MLLCIVYVYKSRSPSPTSSSEEDFHVSRKVSGRAITICEVGGALLYVKWEGQYRIEIPHMRCEEHYYCCVREMGWDYGT